MPSSRGGLKGAALKGVALKGDGGMKFKVDEISSVLREEISQYQSTIDVAEVGRVLEVGDGIARLYGLSNAMAGEMVEFSNGATGQVLNLEEGSVGVAVLGDYLGIREGDEVKRTGKLLSVPCGPKMVGRVGTSFPSSCMCAR